MSMEGSKTGGRTEEKNYCSRKKRFLSPQEGISHRRRDGRKENQSEGRATTREEGTASSYQTQKGNVSRSSQLRLMREGKVRGRKPGWKRF